MDFPLTADPDRRLDGVVDRPGSPTAAFDRLKRRRSRQGRVYPWVRPCPRPPVCRSGKKALYDDIMSFVNESFAGFTRCGATTLDIRPRQAKRAST
jgi:hypothetical protein